MSNTDLSDFMLSATRKMAEDYDRIQKRASEDPGTAGDQGENNWAALLKGWLPHTFHIVTKGRILSHNGIASPQVDILVLQPEYPKHLLDEKLYLAGGVLAAFECKVTLKSNHIEKFVKNSVEIKRNLPTLKGSPYKELQSTIIYGLLAHSHIWQSDNSKPISNIEGHLWEADENNVIHPIQMPDLLCVANLGYWTATKSTFLGPHTTNYWSEQISSQYGVNGSATSGYMRYSQETNIRNKGFSPIGAMITDLLTKLTWRIPSLKSIAQYFHQSSLMSSGEGFVRTWESSIYSEEIRRRIEYGEHGKNEGEWLIMI